MKPHAANILIANCLLLNTPIGLYIRGSIVYPYLPPLTHRRLRQESEISNRYLSFANAYTTPRTIVYSAFLLFRQLVVVLGFDAYCLLQQEVGIR